MDYDHRRDRVECVRTICLVLAIAAGLCLLSYVGGYAAGEWLHAHEQY